MLLLPENIGVACLDMLPPATIASKLSLLCSALIFPTLLRFPLDFVPGTFGLEPDEENLSMLAAIPVRGFFFSDPSLLPLTLKLLLLFAWAGDAPVRGGGVLAL